MKISTSVDGVAYEVHPISAKYVIVELDTGEHLQVRRIGKEGIDIALEGDVNSPMGIDYFRRAG